MWVVAKTLIICVAIGLANATTNVSAYGTLPQANTSGLTTTDVTTSAIQPLFNMVNNFVNMVLISLSDFMAFLRTYFLNETTLSVDVTLLGQQWNEVAKSVVGYAICLVIGILFIVFVPLVGSIMCCCRTCCDNCGGKMRQTKKRRKSKWRHCFCTSLLLMTILIFVPCVMVFYTSELTRNVMTQLPDESSSVIGYGHLYLENIQSQFVYILAQYDVFAAFIHSQITDLPVMLEADLQAIVDPAIDKVVSLDTSVHPYMTNLELYERSFLAVDQIKTDVQTFQQVFNTNFPDGTSCSSVTSCEIARVTVAGMSSGFSHTGYTNPSTAVQAGKSYLSPVHAPYVGSYATLFGGSLATIIDNSFTNNGITSSFQSAVDSSKTTIEDKTTGLDVFQDLNKTITTSQTDIRSFTGIASTYDYYRWIATIVLSLLILIICLCYLFGIILGCCGNAKDLPTERNNASHCGGILLMSGAGLVFIFAWLLMVLVMLTFAVGAPFERFICQGVESPYLALQFVDDLVNLNLGSGINITFTHLVTSCENNTGVVEAVRLSSLLNVTSISNTVSSSFQTVPVEIDVDLTTIFKLNNAGLRSAVAALGSSSILTITNGVMVTATKPDYSDLRSQLQTAFTDFTTTSQTAKANDMNTAIQDLDAIISKIGTGADYTNLNNALQYCQTNGPLIETNRSSAVQTCQDADDQLENDLNSVINKRISTFRSSILAIVDTYVNWFIDRATNDLGRCELIYLMYKDFTKILCNNLIALLNGFWFSVGWIVFFLLPSAILAMKLSKFYRKMDETDHVAPPPHLRANLHGNSVPAKSFSNLRNILGTSVKHNKVEPLES